MANTPKTHGPRLRHSAYVGGKEAPEHYVWRSMHARCNDPKASSYKRYGGRGIKVCETWSDYRTFLRGMGQRPTPAHSLERKHNDGDYCKSNCAWATRSAQQRNKSSTRFFWNGYLALTLVEASEMLGISKELAHWRFANWSTFERGSPWQELPKVL